MSQSIAMPDVAGVGALAYELASAFAIGEVARQLPQTRERGEQLQVETALLMRDISDRLRLAGVDITFDGAPETGAAWSSAQKAASAVWKRLSAGAGKVLAANKDKGKFWLWAAGLGGVLYTAHDWLTGDEQTRRVAIGAEREAVLALIKKLPEDQVAGALKQASGSLSAHAEQSLPWYVWALLGLTGVAVYHALKGGR